MTTERVDAIRAFKKAQRDVHENRQTDEFRRRAIKLAVAVWNDTGGPMENASNARSALRALRSACADAGVDGLEQAAKAGLVEQEWLTRAWPNVTLPSELVQESIDRVLEYVDAARRERFSDRNVQQLALQQDAALAMYAARAPRTFVCSDVHMGTNETGWQQMLELVALCEKGDSLVLLGDVLDAWLFDRSGKTVAAVQECWEDLFAVLEQIAARVDIHYVMGNHDAFVFPLLARDVLPYCELLVTKSKFLTALAATAKRCNLQDVATVHSGFYALNTTAAGGAPAHKVLLTHGHLPEWYWAWSGMDIQSRRLTGIAAERRFTMSAVTLAAAAKFLDLQSAVRRAFKTVAEGVRFGGSLTDLFALVTFDALEAYAVNGLPAEDFLGFQGFLDEEYMPRLLGRLSVDAHILAGVAKLEEWYEKRDLNDVRLAQHDYLARLSNQAHYTLNKGQVGKPPTETRFGDYKDFEHLVVGHFHKPQRIQSDSGDLTIDDGAMLSSGSTRVITALQINPDGSIGFVPGLSHG